EAAVLRSRWAGLPARVQTSSPPRSLESRTGPRAERRRDRDTDAQGGALRRRRTGVGPRSRDEPLALEPGRPRAPRGARHHPGVPPLYSGVLGGRGGAVGLVRPGRGRGVVGGVLADRVDPDGAPPPHRLWDRADRSHLRVERVGGDRYGDLGFARFGARP